MFYSVFGFEKSRDWSREEEEAFILSRPYKRFQGRMAGLVKGTTKLLLLGLSTDWRCLLGIPRASDSRSEHRQLGLARGGVG